MADNPFASQAPRYDGAVPVQYTAFAGETQSQPLMSSDPRPKNFPPFKPCFHHNIKNDIEQDKRFVVQKTYFGWFFHCFCLLWNGVCMTALLAVNSASVGSFFYALIALGAGVPLSFLIYWFFYSAIRKSSNGYMLLWFGCFAIQIGLEIIYAIGISSMGGAGFLEMAAEFKGGNLAVGVMLSLSFAAWVASALYSLWVLKLGRHEYQHLGGHRQAVRDVGRATAQVAYDNRETVKQVAYDNRETIKQVAYENKDTLVDFARQHRQEIQQVAYDNRQTVARVAVENKDVIWDNRDTVSAVFDDTNPFNRQASSHV